MMWLWNHYERYFLIISEKSLRLKYESFKEHETSPALLGLMLFILSTLYIYAAIHDVIIYAPIEIIIARYVRVFSVIFGWILLYILLEDCVTALPNIRNRFISTTNTGNCLIIWHAISGGVLLFARGLIGDCDGYSGTSVCNPMHGMDGLPIDTMLSNTVFLMVLPVIVKTHTVSALILSWIITMGIMVASIISFHATDVVVVPVFVLLLGIVLYDIERKTLQTFIGWENHEQQAREMFLSERVQDDMKNEQIQMKVIIGNLAHDMKTPMQALVLDLNELREELYTYTGMEPYTDDEDDYSLCNETANLSSCGNTVFKPLQTVAALKRTVGFMNMTIHRAIDYRKASCGLPLVPNMTTIHIPSTVNWAVSLTTSEQDSVKTSIYPISPRVYITRDIVPPSEGGKSSTVQLGSLNSTSKSRNSVQTPPPSPSSRFVPTPIDVKSERRFEALEMNERGMWGGDNTFVVVEVYDTGIGVPDSEKGYLFQPYGQTRRLTGGTGLGLYCLMKRMEALGGVCGMRDRIVQRADGQNVVEGSCFWFAVPYIPDYTGGNSERSSGRLLRVTPKSLNCSYKEPVDNAIGSTIEICPDDGNSSTISDIGENTRSQPASTVCSSASHPHVTTDEIPVSEPASHPIPSSISLNLPDDVDVSHSLPEKVNVEVLLVDDAIVVQKSTSRMLRKAGYRVSIAQNGRIALDMMKKQLYAFVLMDIQMPVMDGIESTHLLREYESQSSLGERQIIIGLSANSDDDTRKEALTAGMNAFIPKPLAVKMLQRCLRECNVSTQ